MTRVKHGPVKFRTLYTPPPAVRWLGQMPSGWFGVVRGAGETAALFYASSNYGDAAQVARGMTDAVILRKERDGALRRMPTPSSQEAA